MGIMRRLFSVGTGLAAGLLAYKLIDRYEKKIQLEGEYRVIAPEEEPQPAGESQASRAPQSAEPNPNPVLRPEPSEVLGPDGRIDPTKVAQAEDFADWDEMGCRG